MQSRVYPLPQFVKDLETIAADLQDARLILQRVCPLAQQLARSKEWLRPRHYACDPAQGFGVHLLHEEPDHTLAVFAIAWLPERGGPPHNHGTWGVVVGVDGSEKNVFWTRLDDGSRPGYAEIRKQGEKAFGPGEVIAFLPDDIHSVANETTAVTVSLHVYGKHLNYTRRSQFDPVKHTETPFILTVQ